MKSKVLITGIAFALIFINQSCNKDDFNVPDASTQAKFTWTQEIVAVGTETKFKLSFFNQSIEALSYSWDFGNGETSTDENPVVYFDEGEYTVTLTVTSAKDLHYNKLTESANLRLILKNVHFIEDFDEESSLDRFNLIDADGDGQNWYWDSFEEDGYLLSRSWSSQLGPLTPDNWIITPEIDLSEVLQGKEIILNFSVCPTANTPIYRTEHYSVLVSTTGTAIADFTDVIWDETLTQTMVNWVYELREIDISTFAGQKIRIAFRHHDSTDKDRISLNDFEVYSKL
jgi:hypothetical protein